MTGQNASSSAENRRVAVFGASGHTGRFVVAELLQRGFSPIAIGRDAERLAAAGFPQGRVEARVASIEDAASLDQALIGAAAVINTAGPFLDTMEALAAAAIRARVHYLDVSAEQASASTAFERFARPAREAGVVLVPAMGFYGGFGDLLATAAMGDWTSADEIHLRIALDSWRPTRGTRITGERNTVPRLVIANSELAPLSLPATEGSWTFAEPFGVQDMVELPFSETVLISRHLRVRELRTWLNLAPLRDLREASTPPPTAADDSGRSAQRFLVEATVIKAGTTRRATASGRDIYAFTAPLVVEAVQRILAGDPGRSGVLAAGEMVEAADFLRALTPAHLTLEID